MNYGEPLPPDTKVEAVEYINQHDLGPLLMKHVIDKHNLPLAAWCGHVALSVNEGRYGLTVYVWRAEEKAAQ